MKKLLLTTLILSTISVSHAVVNLPYDDLYIVDDQLIAYKNKQSGVIDKSGKLTSPMVNGDIIAVFDDVIISKTDKVIFTDHNGKVVFETNHRFIDFYDDKLVQFKDDQWTHYLVDHQGNKVEINEDEAIYKNRKIQEQGYGKRGFIDLNGKEIVPCVYSKFKVLDMGYIAFVNKENLWGLMDKVA